MTQRPVAHAQRLVARANISRAVRTYLWSRDYIEIEAPTLVVSPGLEPHLDAFEVPTGGRRRYLHTSPEYALKRLMGDGFQRLFSLGPCYRDEPSSSTHSPEFTMLEWYREGATLADTMDETEALVSLACEAVHGCTQVGEVDLKPPFRRLSLRQAFIDYVGLDAFAFTTAAGLRDEASRVGATVHTDSESYDDVFFQLFLNLIEPRLAEGKPTFLFGYPRSQAALARLDPEDPTTALRFELYAGGFELANAFDELTDAVEQEARFRGDLSQRKAGHRQQPPIDLALLAAVGRMKPTCGVALGFDRLVMLITDATHIDDVRAQPWDDRQEGLPSAGPADS
ncbi:MAG: EF-P lysine aminoacylase GenX [Myxococcales bacterium]|nr:EF-P lysine aminoacylase GenX [Myxococcales bacterium]